jgi:hypothetical protein
VFSRAAFTIVLVHNQCPWLPPRFEQFGNIGNGTGDILVLIKGLIYIASFIVNGLKTVRTRLVERSDITYRNY